MSLGFDNYAINHQLLLAMTIEETTGGNGDFIYDRAKPHHRMTLVDAGTGTLTWGATAAVYPYLNLDPTIPGAWANYVWIECLAADAADLDFTTDDFTLLAWVYLDNLTNIHTIMCYGAQNIANGGGYQLGISAATPTTLSFSTCQATTLQTSISSAEIAAGTWYLVGATRSAAVGKTYINGLNKTVTSAAHVNPATQTEPFHLGVRQIERTAVAIDYDTPYEGFLAYPRVWDRTLPDADMLEIFNVEKHWFNL